MKNNFVDILTEENQVLRKRLSLLGEEIGEKDKKIRALEEERELMQAKINELSRMLMNAQGPIDPQAVQSAISQTGAPARASTTNSFSAMFDNPDEVKSSPFL